MQWEACSRTNFVVDYLGLIESVRSLNTTSGTPGGPAIFLSIPPPLTGAPSSDEPEVRVVSELFPVLIRLIAARTAASLIDHFSAFGGEALVNGTAQLPCRRVATDAPPCSLMCDSTWCDNIHPTDAGYRRLAETTYAAIAPRLSQPSVQEAQLHAASAIDDIYNGMVITIGLIVGSSVGGSCF